MVHRFLFVTGQNLRNAAGASNVWLTACVVPLASLSPKCWLGQYMVSEREPEKEPIDCSSRLRTAALKESKAPKLRSITPRRRARSSAMKQRASAASNAA